MLNKSVLYKKLIYISILFLSFILSSEYRQNTFLNKKYILPKNVESNLPQELSDGQEINLKHIFHFGDLDEGFEISKSSKSDSNFYQWDASENQSYTQAIKLDFKALDILFNSKIDQNELLLSTNPELLKTRQAILSLAKMAGHAYHPLPKKPWKDMGPGWKEIDGFGWQENKVRGYIFSDKSGKNIVIAFKGTTFSFLPGGDLSTAPNDRVSDNLMFSCCCGATNANWRQVCSCSREHKTCSQKCLTEHAKYNTTYFHGAQAIYEAAKIKYSDANILLVGHSLGGSLASLVAHKMKAHAVTFEAPGDRLYARRLGLELEEGAKPFVYHFGNNADPIYMGTCNGLLSLCYIGGYGMDSKCHTARKCTFDVIKDFDWSESIFHHRMTEVINEILTDWAEGKVNLTLNCTDSKTDCEDCKDWTFV